MHMFLKEKKDHILNYSWPGMFTKNVQIIVYFMVNKFSLGRAKHLFTAALDVETWTQVLYKVTLVFLSHNH